MKSRHPCPHRWSFVLRLLIACVLGASVGLGGQFSPLALAQGPFVSPVERDARTETNTDTTPKAGPLRTNTVPFQLEKTPLDAIILYSPEGKRSIVLPGGWPLDVYDEFSKFLMKDHQEPTALFIIQSIVARGRVVHAKTGTQQTSGGRVEAEVRFLITTTSPQIVRVPLGMKEGILHYPEEEQTSSPYYYAGPGRVELTVDRLTGEYVALIGPRAAKKNTAAATDESISSVAPDEQRHEIILSLWFQLASLGEEEQRLAISFPQAVSSQFLLTVPVSDAVATITQGALLDVLPTPDGRATLFNILGLKPNFDVSWRKKRDDPVDNRPILYAEQGTVVVRMENKTTFFDATIPIHSPTGSFERVRIRLPQGSILDHDDAMEQYATAGNYSLRLLPEEEQRAWSTPSNDQVSLPPIVEVLFAQKITGPVEVRIKAVQQHGVEKPGAWRNLGGFDVVGAERQYGFLSIVIPADMRPNWNPIRGVRRIDLPQAVGQDRVDARFEYFSQPFSLRAQIVSPQTRINVKPEYQVGLSKGAATLTANLSFAVHGSKTEKLAVQLFDWQWTGDIKPTNLIDLDGVSQDASGLLTIPLRSPMDGTFDMELKAHRVFASDEDRSSPRLVVRIPQPEANWVNSATFVVVPADNIEVTPVRIDTKTVAANGNGEQPNHAENANQEEENPRVSAENLQPLAPLVPVVTKLTALPAEPDVPGRTMGLARRGRRSLPLRIDLPLRQQDPLIYETESTNAVFVADIQYHQQEIKANIATDIRLLDSEDQVIQVISYDVAYEPVHRIFLSVPESLDATGQLRVSLGGKLLELRDVSQPSEVDLAEGRSRKRIALPEEMIGKFQLTVRYSVPPVHVEAGMTTPTTFPLVRPLDVTIAPHRVNVVAPQGYQIELYRETNHHWKSIESGSKGSSLRVVPETSFTTSQSTDRIALLISVEDRDILGTTVVERAWLRTWFNDTVRCDCGIYQINSDRDSISLWLPSQVARDRRVVVYCDREPVPVALSPKGELTVSLTDDQKRRSFLLEVWYQFSLIDKGPTFMELPHFSEDSLVRAQYWQILLPQNRHIIGVPTGWTPEYQWSRVGMFWGRVPSIRMEAIGLHAVTSDENPISPEANQYLYSSLTPPSRSSFYVADRSVIVLFSSSVSLFIGLILIYFPKTRYAGSLLGLVIALIAMVAYQPAPVLLMLQASSLGVLLALGACYVYRIVYRDEQWIVPTMSGSPGWKDRSALSKVYSVIMDESSDQVVLRQASNVTEEK